METALRWSTYSVKRSSKEPLLRFVIRALEQRDCRILFASEPDRAPFYVVFETPGGVPQGVLVYAFLANAKTTKNRPRDEHRFQIKYGSDLKTVLHLAVDPHKLITTILIGIDTERDLFVAADPLMNTPAPMSRSVEFKAERVAEIAETGWAAWERDRRAAKTRDREAFDAADLRTEVLVGGRQDRLLDLIALEQIARGLDPGERHLLADKLRQRSNQGELPGSHSLLTELDVTSEQLMDLIEGAGRLKMAVRGWVAEAHLTEYLSGIEGVSDCMRLEADGRPDVSLRWRGGPPILIECKNTLRTQYADGRPKVDFQRTRASKGNPCSRYYSVSDFNVLAACLHPVTDRWIFEFAATKNLPAHRSCHGRISNAIAVEAPVFTSDPESVFTECSV